MMGNRVKTQISDEQFGVRVRRKTATTVNSERLGDVRTTNVAQIIVGIVDTEPY